MNFQILENLRKTFDEESTNTPKASEKLSPKGRRKIAELGIYPAVDPLDSSSRILEPGVLGDEHYGVARDVHGLSDRRQVRAHQGAARSPCSHSVSFAGCHSSAMVIASMPGFGFSGLPFVRCQ